MQKLIFSKSFLASMLAIVATGAALNMAAKGHFGDQVKKGANFVTEGFGAGPIA